MFRFASKRVTRISRHVKSARIAPPKCPIAPVSQHVSLTHSNSLNIPFVTPCQAPMRSYATLNYIRSPRKLRSVAIVAHVDTGKTTLTNALLIQTQTLKDATQDRVMDSMDLERERGITIMSKITSVQYNDHFLNIIDSPGHTDMGAEVERCLNMVDGVVLLVDATDGPMPQTRFVLGKALAQGLKPIVVVNKVDMPSARPEEVHNEIFDLFVELDANDDQLDFPILYGSARAGWLVSDLEKDERKDCSPLFDAIIEHIPPPKILPSDERGLPMRMLVTSIDYDKHYGRLLTGKITQGIIRKNDKIKTININGEPVEEGKILQVMIRTGLARVPVEMAEAGDLVSLAGLVKSGVSDTLCSGDVTEALPTTEIDPPLISVGFRVNDSPLAGREGTQCSSLQLRDRLLREAENNVSLRIEPDPTGDSVQVSGRGEMQLGILIETMRREGFEFQVSTPKVLYKRDPETREILEPIEEVIVDVEPRYTAKVMEMMNNRQGEMQSFKENGSNVRMVFEIGTRNLIGFSSEFKQECKGSGSMTHILRGYEPFKGFNDVEKRKGVLVAIGPGKSTAFALQGLEARGTLFIGPQVDVYEGMIVGENAREGEMVINPAKTKHLTNMRSAGKDDMVRLAPPRQMTLEEALTWIQDDELIEVTPSTYRLRKKILTENERKKQKRRGKMAELEASVP